MSKPDVIIPSMPEPFKRLGTGRALYSFEQVQSVIRDSFKATFKESGTFRVIFDRYGYPIVERISSENV